MADRGPNLDLWMATAGPRQPLKGVFYARKFLTKNFALLAVRLKQCFSKWAESPLGAILNGKGAKKQRGRQGAKQHRGGENAQPLVDQGANFSCLIL